jgi:hypothetical protein
MRGLLVLAMAACGNDHATPDAPGLDGLPCDVRDVLANACTVCHSNPPTSNAPQAFVSRMDFLLPSSVDGQNLGERSEARLHDAVRPMPPLSEPPASAAQIATLDNWFVGGMPAGSCGELPMRHTLPTCASGVLWEGSTDNTIMEPGKACIYCHEIAAPTFSYFFMGTAFPAYHEGDDCEDPPPADGRIEILDASGAVTLTLVPNSVGNFYSSSVTADTPIPYTARVVSNGLMRAMTTPQMTGDCNACHTEQGTTISTGAEAPGRIVWPAPRP